MRYRTLGKTNLKVSEIGFGGWQISGDWGNIHDDSTQVVESAIEAGINLFDSAYVYGDGESERALGKALKPHRDKVIVTSKIPPKNFRWDVKAHHKVSDFYDKKWIIEATERSLKNYGVDYIDVQMLHTWNDIFVEQDEWYAAVEQLKQDGKIRHLGVSIKSWEFDQGIAGMKNGMLEVIQVLYNIFEQRPAEKLFPAALEHNVGLITRVPFDEGLLTGNYLPGHTFADNDWRKNWLTEERLQQAAPRIEELKKLLDQDTPNLSDLAIKFCLADQAVSCTIAGARRIEHVQRNAAVASQPPLNQSTVAALTNHAWPHNWHYDGDND